MTEQSVTIIVAILGALGAGGLGAAIVNGIFNRPKLLSEVYEQRLKALTDRVTCLEEKDVIQTDKIDRLKNEIDKREDMIEALQRENEDLKGEIKKLKAENKCKDDKIAKLQSQVADLTTRLDAMNGSDCG
jgi:hypothetical protein